MKIRENKNWLKKLVDGLEFTKKNEKITIKEAFSTEQGKLVMATEYGLWTCLYGRYLYVIDSNAKWAMRDNLGIGIIASPYPKVWSKQYGTNNNRKAHKIPMDDLK